MRRLVWIALALAVVQPARGQNLDDYLARYEARRRFAIAAGNIWGIANACEVSAVEIGEWRRTIELRWRQSMPEMDAARLIEIMRDAQIDGFRMGSRQRAAACPDIRRQMQILLDSVNGRPPPTPPAERPPPVELREFAYWLGIGTGCLPEPRRSQTLARLQAINATETLPHLRAAVAAQLDDGLRVGLATGSENLCERGLDLLDRLGPQVWR